LIRIVADESPKQNIKNIALSANYSLLSIAIKIFSKQVIKKQSDMLKK